MQTSNIPGEKRDGEGVKGREKVTQQADGKSGTPLKLPAPFIQSLIHPVLAH